MKKPMQHWFPLWLFICAGWMLRGDVIDRIAISVGMQVITEAQIEQEVRITAVLNDAKIDLSTAERKKAAGRLIEQALVKREMEFSRYPQPAPSETDATLREAKARYASEAAYQDALRQYGISEDDLKQRLLWQLTLLRFIDFRFRPGIQISDSEVQAYYQQQRIKWQQQGVQPVPSLADARPQIEEILTQQRIDQSLDQWLAEARGQVPIRYHDEALQ
ncbi:MAG TPA: hypothetical protein VEV17_03645 [Bryobacteraceae bacterium]|nr:hypothetical protein [Bryobacteraceae bacterium]